MPDTPALDLAALQALTDAATPGPWRLAEGMSNWIDAGDYDEVIRPAPVNCMAYCYGGTSAIDLSDADAAFIAAARTAVPALLARVADLQADNERLRALVDSEDLDPANCCANRFPETWTGIVCLTCPDLSRTAPTKGTPQ